MEDDRLGKTLAITSLYPEKPHPHSGSSRIPQIHLREPRSSLGVNSSGPYLGPAEHACQCTFEFLGQLPPPRS